MNMEYTCIQTFRHKHRRKKISFSLSTNELKIKELRIPNKSTVNCFNKRLLCRMFEKETSVVTHF